MGSSEKNTRDILGLVHGKPLQSWFSILIKHFIHILSQILHFKQFIQKENLKYWGFSILINFQFKLSAIKILKFVKKKNKNVCLPYLDDFFGGAKEANFSRVPK